jgi:hypothetical protein
MYAWFQNTTLAQVQERASGRQMRAGGCMCLRCFFVFRAALFSAPEVELRRRPHVRHCCVWLASRTVFTVANTAGVPVGAVDV